MRVLCAVVLVLASLQLALAQNPTNGSWTGVWRNDALIDDFGGLMTTCVDGTRLQGTFSAIGFVEGTTRGRNVSGTWKVGGYTDNVYGGFEWTLNADNKGFTGYFWYNDEPCVYYGWNSTRLESILNSDCHPLTTDTSLTIGGHWQSGKTDFGVDDLYICVNDDDSSQFHGSYELDPRGIHAFVWGRTFDRGVSAQGSYYDNNGVEGMGIFKMLSRDSMVTYQYNVPYYSAAFEDYYSPNVNRRQITWTRIDKSSETLCNRHKDLLPYSWEGTWTANFVSPAARFYLCSAEDGSAWGMYGEYSYFQGQIAGNKFTGRFYDAGRCSGCQGNFSLTLASTFQSFSGTYFYDNDPKTIFKLNEKRVDATPQYESGCATPAGGSVSAQGRWKIDSNDFLDICLTATSKNVTETGKMEGSATFDGEPVYFKGVYSNNGQLIQFSYRTETNVGVGLMVVTGSKTLLVTGWETEEDSNIPSDFSPCLSDTVRNQDFEDGHFLQANSYDTTTSSSRCKRFSYLEDQELAPSNPPVDAASSLSFFEALLFALLSFSLFLF